jgi:outer membrane biosynthesis protein TonB
MRRETPLNQHHCAACHGSGTRVEVHRSRNELERVLSKFGAEEVLFVEADANAAIQFAMHGRCVQLALPLPDPENARFTHTPTGKPRTTAAQERAYEQALREHWRSLVVAVRGKLQSVESGISTFEQEFDRFLVAGFSAAEKKRRDRKKPRGVNWLLGGSHSLAIALVAAFLVPASAVGAFVLPTNVVGHLAAPFRSAVSDDSSAGGTAADGVALARGGWSPSFGGDAGSSDASRLLAMRAGAAGDVEAEPRETASLSSPPPAPIDVPPAPSTLAAESSTPLPVPQPPASESENKPAPADPAPPSPAADEAPVPDETPLVIPDEPASDTVVAAPDAPPVSDDGTTSPDKTAPSETASGNGNGQGNGNANGQDNGNGHGNGNDNPPGQSTAPGQAGTPPGQGGTPPGQANDPPGQGNGQGKGQGNGKPKGGK